ncbi:MAG: ECF transporter S component [Oscillospiraceae bacterium]
MPIEFAKTAAPSPDLLFELSGKNLSLVMTLIMSAALLIMLVRCGKKGSPIYLSTLSVMTALSVVGRMVFAPLSGFKPCTAVIMITGITLGADAGFVCGALTAVVSNVYFGQGTWTLFQMFCWGLIGFLAGIMSKPLSKNVPLRYVFAVSSGFFYSLLMDLFSAVWQDGGFSLVRFAALSAGSLPFAAVYAVSNVIFLALMFGRLSRAIERVCRKYGLNTSQK